jgi:hypothetical protein
MACLGRWHRAADWVVWSVRLAVRLAALLRHRGGRHRNRMRVSVIF